jgi:REP element-mobilizing transposase RayT
MTTFSKLWVHLIWSTKNREPILQKPLRQKLFQYIKQESAKHKIYLDCVDGVEDHVHCLINLKPSQSISIVVKQLKGESSYWINLNNLLENNFQWQRGFGAFSVSHYNVPKVRNYILNQESHHKKISYDEEIKKFI